MNNFFKQSFFVLVILSPMLLLSEAAQIPQAMPLPSVADVFGGLSEQEIAEQVQMGQQFLEDLQKNGSPQEIAEFQKLLEETLNSMSEQDFNDITAIAKMVEPHLAPPSQETSQPVVEPTKDESKDVTIATSELDEFKKLISTITQRIDDIFQKINSSKECAEQVDAKWKNKSTFNNMKRQIYQLRTDRLAQKLCKKDLKDDDKKLVNALKEFLKDLTHHNDALIIEDDFGLPVSHAQEKKHLKQTKSFLDSCDDYIDKLMPLLEKFLQKWDPEALQIAKETEARSKKAAKDAADETIRKASPAAIPKSPATGGGYIPPAQSGSYPSYGGYYPDYYENYPGGTGGSQSPDSQSAAKSGSEAKKAKDKSEINASTPAPKEKSKDKNDLYDYAMSELEGHINDYFDLKHENSFADFMQKDITNYPDYTFITGPGGPLLQTVPAVPGTAAATNIPTTTTDPAKEDAWIDSKAPFPISGSDHGRGFALYANNIKRTVEKDFAPEFEPLKNVLDDLNNSIPNMNVDELKKLPNAKELANVENRLKRYQTIFESILPKLDDMYKINTTPATANAPAQNPGIITPLNVAKYQNVHDNFVMFLKNKIGNKINELRETINTIKRRAKRNAAKKSSKSS